MKAKLIYGILTSAVLSANALEFGGIGNTSAGMGGAGVALKDSAFGLYYNPALLSAEPRIKLGYSLGIGFREQNLSKLADIDLNNMQDVATRLIETFTSGAGTAAGEITNIVEGALKSVLTTAGQNPTGNVADDLKTYLGTSTSGNHADLISAVLQQVQGNTNINDTQKSLLQDIAGSIDYDNLSFGGTAGAAQATQDLLSNITIAKGGDAGLDKAVSDIAAVQEILKDNNLNIISQNGVVLQLANARLNQALGSFAIGYFGSAYANMSIDADENRMRLIIQGGQGYYELTNNGSSFTFKQSTKDDYEKYSLLNSIESNSNAHKLIATSFVLQEVPLGYARTFYLRNGNLNIGVAGKFMSALSSQRSISLNKGTDITKEITNFASFGNATSSSNFGIDIGAVYEVDMPRLRYITLGVVAKNINSPSFKSDLQDIVIKPQYRAGIAYNGQNFTLAFDYDILPNDLISFANIKQQSQMIGGGANISLKLIDFRVGVMKDLKQDTGLILTGGINLFSFLDIALQTSTDISKVQNIPIPTYFNLKIGGSFSF